MDDVELTVVMPCLNEARTLEVCIRRVKDTFDRHGVKGEVVVGDNGSTDGSQALARSLGARVVDIPVKGYGAALRGGFSAARGQYIVMGDSDASYDFSEIPRYLARLRQGDELVMGNRFAGGIKPGAMPWKNKWVGNPILSGIGRLFFRIPVRDFHCGLRGFSKAAVERLDLRSTGMEFASEMVVKARLHGLRMSEVPATLSPDGRDRPPHLNPWRDGWRHLRFLLLYSPRWLFLYPGLLLMLIGGAIHVLLLPGPLHIGDTELDIHTLMYGGAMILVGAQAVFFAVIAKVFAITEGLVPEPPEAQRWFRAITLEHGLVVGGVFGVAGVIGSLAAVIPWAQTGFGPYEPQTAMRIIVPSVVMLALSAQTIFSSFLLSLLGMKRT
ncbi:MAG TPA: glycosyltransferase family 2 protein [Vicinamibacterales bacterium]|nr:glycosyltransferase family 2 protein [Vicinamibacterales bacterium]